MFGIPIRWTSAGPHTVMDIGTTLGLGAGLGWTMRLGASLHFTMAAGLSLAALGAGARDRYTRGLSMVRHSSDFWVADSASDSDSAADLAWAGSRWDSANRSIPGITPAEIISAT